MHSSFGRAISARAHRHHLLLAARQRAGDLVAPFLDAREQRIDPLEVLSISAASRG